MKKLLLPFLTVLLLLSHTPAFGQGPYLGGVVLYNNPLGSDIDYLDPGLGLGFTFGFDFGPVALEGNLFGSSHNDTDPGYGGADFDGFGLDLKVFLSHIDDPDRIYFLAGLGSYSIEEFDPFLGADTELVGSGFNLGAGLEHYLNWHTALDLALIYRIVRYDEFDIAGSTFLLEPDENGDTLSLRLGFNYHF